MFDQKRPATYVTCPVCGRQVEAHREGWTYDHDLGSPTSPRLCPGSGQHPLEADSTPWNWDENWSS